MPEAKRAPTPEEMREIARWLRATCQHESAERVESAADALAEREWRPYQSLAELRRNGWSVAVHNDYRVNGREMTFWLFTHPSGQYVKGEGDSDQEALNRALAASHYRLPSPPPAKEGEKT